MITRQWEEPHPIAAKRPSQWLRRLQVFAFACSCMLVGVAGVYGLRWDKFTSKGPNPVKVLESMDPDERMQAIMAISSRYAQDTRVLFDITVNGSPEERVQAKLAFERADRHRK